ncbi:competence protein ComK [Bacillus suaedaesalsae]|uniref:Competence protein ComK n=1 Tax=Bacillus suaedaesalsae TaxID=2810349 RepID=A0ABS2DMC7_9BACI|nr:competence protein ComK [Bacillus suaedaesalsae]MBM6618656.1 competence protein ComK [Bacillus suaedaesalsae]
MKELKHYEISPTTLAILPAYHATYASKILDLQGEFYCKETPMKLIEHACLEGGSSLEGRRKALRHKLSFHQYPPIPINPLEDIYAFPTCSPESYECIWLFYEHILHLQPHHQSTIVTFHNHQTLEVHISIAVMKKQMSRTESCIVAFSRPRLRKFMFYQTSSTTTSNFV